ncbi:TonB-dependent receptor [Bacteroides sp. f07]|uniref:SusC/RagA family TonB-linked outer membrane protein n=1 Tax=Bacteroides sp. f07 TaxID=3132704 RepID=UPI0034A6F9B6
MKKRNVFMSTCLFLWTGIAMAQVSQATGVVVSLENNEPIVGASVLVKGTTLGTITDIDGRYKIDGIPTNAKTLVISFVGMKTQELAIKNGEQKVTMQSDSEMIDEVVVVAYGTRKKSSFTGAASTIGVKSIEKRAITNITAALEGNASGVQVTAATGQPGSSSSIRIRGFGSVNASNAPLYIVDGAIYNGSIGDINPADIESMTILKDAASTSLYGSSAGNGVVLITTKKGKGSGGTEVNLTINQGWSNRAYKDYKKIGIYDYYPLQWEMLKNSYITSGKDAATAATLATLRIGSILKYNPFAGIANDAIVGINGKLNPSAYSLKWGDDLDWENAAFKTGYRQEYNLSYNTKAEKSDTYASIGYLNDAGYMIKTDFKRYSGRLNYNVYPTKWFKAGLNLGVTRTVSNYSTSDQDNSGAYSNLTRFIRTMAPIYPIHKHDLETGAYLDANGKTTTNPSEYIYDYKGSRLSDNGRDAIAEAELNRRELVRINQTGHTYLTLAPIQGLNLTVNYSINNIDYRRKIYENPYVGDGTAGPGRLEQRSIRTLTQTFNQLLTYNKSVGNHYFDILLGHENYSYKYENLHGMKTQETIAGIYEFNNFVNTSLLRSYTNTYKKEGYFGRINYDYAHKYYASFSYRYDGSSRFAKENRWGHFYSFGAGWRISEETFMKDVKWVNNLKLRASYGETGNDNILDRDGLPDYYPYQTLYGLGYKNGSEAGVYFTTMANPALKWETQISTDIALEFNLFDCLTGTIEYFKKYSKDLLFAVSQPASIGVTSIIQNIGKVSNSGVEIELDYNIIKNKDWSVSVGANATFMKNKIKNLPTTMKENGYISGSKKWMEGKSIYEFWLRQWYGVDPKTGNGLYVADVNKYNSGNIGVGKGNITQSQFNEYKKTVVTIDGKELTNSYTYAKYDFSGSSIPDVYGGFNVKVSYKNFDLSVVFSYQLGGQILDTNYATMMSTANFGYAQSTDLLKAWKQAGDITNIPRIDNNATHATNIGQPYSTRWLTSSDYLNLRSVTIGYQFPKNWLSKLMLKSAHLNLTAENLFMLKARQGLNPMANYSGITYNEYMPSRNITLGLNVSF